jgi:translation initiation factor IF-1
MPVKIKSVGHGKVQVRTPNGVKAKATTPAKAQAQKRLLNAVEHGWKPGGIEHRVMKQY